jgi:hypothetical protein
MESVESLTLKVQGLLALRRYTLAYTTRLKWLGIHDCVIRDT